MVILGLKKTHWSSLFCIAIWYVYRWLQNKNLLDSVVKYVLWFWVERKKNEISIIYPKN